MPFPGSIHTICFAPCQSTKDWLNTCNCNSSSLEAIYARRPTVPRGASRRAEAPRRVTASRALLASRGRLGRELAPYALQALTLRFEARNPKPQNRNQKPDTRNPKPEIRRPKETRNLEPQSPNLHTPNSRPLLSTLHPPASALNPQPSTTKLQSSTCNPQPSTLNPQPSTLNSQNSMLNPQFATRNPQPSPPHHLQAGAVNCMACPAHASSLAGATARAQCECAAGLSFGFFRS